MIQINSSSFIGIFDSGVGGLSVLKAIRSEMPSEAIVYLADQGHVPYGPRPLEEVRRFSEEISRFLLESGAKLMVVACNAASAAALNYLREKHPSINFVGMEPAVKPAAENSASRVVAVLATPATFQGALYASVVERFGSGVQLLQDTCPGLVEAIEGGDLNGPLVRQILEKALNPMLEKGADTVVLGCTHYPFVIPMIEAISGTGVRVIDPAPAVARQVRRVLEKKRLSNPQNAPDDVEIQYFTTGETDRFAEAVWQFTQQRHLVRQLEWVNGSLMLPGVPK